MVILLTIFKGVKKMYNHLLMSKVDSESRITIPQAVLNNTQLKSNSTVVIKCNDDKTICIQPKK